MLEWTGNVRMDWECLNGLGMLEWTGDVRMDWEF